jgi:hypothetical protein
MNKKPSSLPGSRPLSGTGSRKPKVVQALKETEKLAVDARLLEEELARLRDQIAKDAEKKNAIP